MKHIRTFESYKEVKIKLSSINKKDLINAYNESVLQVGDTYKVRSMVDIPQSLINSYVKKVKDSTGKNLRQFFGDVEIAEELLKYITLNGLDLEKIPGNALMGGAQGQGQGQAQGGQVQVDTQSQGQAQEGQDFEEPQAQEGQGQAQGQGQGQGQGQAQGQGQGQGQAQGQGQGQAQGQGQKEKEEGQGQKEKEEGEEELPV